MFDTAESFKAKIDKAKAAYRVSKTRFLFSFFFVAQLGLNGL